jgi:hypothetical protein
MRNRLFITTVYANLYAHKTKQAIINTKDNAIEHRAEIARLAGTAVVVGVAARVNGFKAGYAFANNAAA